MERNFKIEGVCLVFFSESQNSNNCESFDTPIGRPSEQLNTETEIADVEPDLSRNSMSQRSKEKSGKKHWKSELEMDSMQNQGRKGSKHVMWSTDMDCILTEILLEQAALGNKGDYGWKPWAFNAARDAIRERLGKDVTCSNIRGRLKTWRSQYTGIKELLNQSGFRWNNVTKRLEAPKSVWQDYIYVKKSKTAAKYRGVTVPNFNELAIIIGNDYATGTKAVTPPDVDMDIPDQADETPTDMVGLDEITEIPEDETNPVELLPPQTQAARRRKRRRNHRVDLRIVQVLDKISDAIDGMTEALREVAKGKRVEVSSITRELRKIEGFDHPIVIKATRFLASDPTLVDIFFDLPDEARKDWLKSELGI